MNATEIAQDIQQREGWTDATLLDLVLEYVQNQDANDAFRDHLEEHGAGGGEPQTREVHLRLAVTVPEGATSANDWGSWTVGQVMLSDPASPAAAIARIVDYNWAGEQRDYEDAGHNGNSRQNHIFNDLRSVRAWLDSAPGQAMVPAPHWHSATGTEETPCWCATPATYAPAEGYNPSDPFGEQREERHSPAVPGE
jgi:hypothetical protein